MNAFAELKTILREWPARPVPTDNYPERPHERLRKALAGFDGVDSVDLAILIRHMLRYETGNRGGFQKVQVPFEAKSMAHRGGLGINTDADSERFPSNQAHPTFNLRDFCLRSRLINGLRIGSKSYILLDMRIP